MIAIVYPQYYGIGGISRYLDSFLANLPTVHPPIYLITGDENRIDQSYPGVEIMHVPFSSNRFSLTKWAIRVRKLLVNLYNHKKIRLVNFHFPPLIPGLFLPCHIPMILTAHTTYLGMSGSFYKTPHFDSPWNSTSLSIKMWMEKRIFKRSSKVITLTEQGRQEVLAYSYKDFITVIPNGVDILKFADNEKIRKKFDVLFSGRIEMRKGSRSMVELCCRLINEKPDISICIVGYGEDEVYVRKTLRKFNNNISFTGKVVFSEMKNYYNLSRIYVSTSYYEGLPGTCLEAMAMGLPVVVWDFLFYKDLVIDGDTGLLIPPNDYKTMTANILDLLSNYQKIKTLGNNARQLIEERHSWTQLSLDILKVFEL